VVLPFKLGPTICMLPGTRKHGLWVKEGMVLVLGVSLLSLLRAKLGLKFDNSGQVV